MQIDLSNHTAIVTGASGELGRVIARTLAGCGAAVAIHYLHNETKARELQRELGAAPTCLVRADVTHEDEVLAMREVVTSKLGAADIIVNNAVSQYPWLPVLEQPVEDYEAQFRSCVLQNVLMAKTFVPAMTEKGWGRIIAINTECAMQCAPGQSAYVAGKRGMDGLLRTLAREVGSHGITVNQVAPGWMISDKYREDGVAPQEAYERNVPLGHRGEDIDIANAVAFLACDLARFITGLYLPVCGGNVMPCI